MRKLLSIFIFLPLLSFGQWSTFNLGAKNQKAVNQNILITDSISNTWGQYDSVITKAAFPGLRLKGRTGWQGNTPFVLDTNGNVFSFASAIALGSYIPYTDTIPRRITTKKYVDSFAALKVDKTTTVNGHALSSNVTVSATDIGLGNVNNTSDVNKPISTAAQIVFDTKLNVLDTPFMLSPYLKKRDSSLYLTQTQALNLVSYGSLTTTLAAYLLKADTPAMLAAYLRHRDSNVYAGYVTPSFLDSALFKRYIANIDDYGADRTGVLNSRAALQAAIATGKPIILIPIANPFYIIEDTSASPAYPMVTIGSNTTIMGQSRLLSVLKTSTNSAILGVQTNTSGYNFTLRGSGTGKNDTVKRLQTGLVAVNRIGLDYHDIVFKCFSGGHDPNAAAANNGGAIVLVNGGGVIPSRGFFSNIFIDSCNVGASADNRSEYYAFSDVDISNSRIPIWLGAGNINWRGGNVSNCLYSMYVNDKANSGNNGHSIFSAVHFNHCDSTLIDSTVIGLTFSGCHFYNGSTVGASYFRIKNSVGIHFTGCNFSQQNFILTNNRNLSMVNCLEFIANTYTLISGQRFSVMKSGNNSIGITTDTLIISDLLTSKNLYSTSAIPTAVAGAGAGTGGTVTIETGGTNQRFTVTIVPGTTPAANDTVATITLSGSFAYPTQCKPVFSAVNAATATLSGASSIYFVGSTTKVYIKSNTLAIPAGTYVYNVTTGN